jgi:hypothetical protein
MNAYFYFPAPDPAFVREGGDYRSEKMSTPVIPEPGIMTPETHEAAEKPQHTQSACLQEQFSGPLPLRSERTMAEILAERLAEAGPDSPCPVFVP